MTQFHSEIDKLDYLGVQVWLEGPPAVIPPSQELISCASRCIRPLRTSIAAVQSFGKESPEYADTNSAVAEIGFEFLAQVQRFAEVARRVLDDEGTGELASPAVEAQTSVPEPSGERPLPGPVTSTNDINDNR
ncbi:hypothetical protein [Streptomyces sp. RK75]|uniref:hypothetical protein n=1 Tax=Streptomyces sp. RK75 TaxID=2824895 RepID=UPI001B35BEEF|nr:hypothetical protein [Streptomyces sp. RK75]MBQ0868293.1 hypothetical protein [Streptomyces sp. RK75]